MQASIVAGTTKSSAIGTGAGHAVSPLQATTPGRKLLLAVGLRSTSPGTITVSDNSSQAGAANTWVQVLAISGTSATVALFYCDCTRSILATDSITESATGSVAGAVGVSEWVGLAPGNAAGTKTTTGTSATLDTGNIVAATSEAGDLVVGVFCQASALGLTVGTDGTNTMTSLHAPAAASSFTFLTEYLIEIAAPATYKARCSSSGSTTYAAGVARFAPIARRRPAANFQDPAFA